MNKRSIVPLKDIQQLASPSLANCPGELAPCAFSFDPARRTFFSYFAVAMMAGVMDPQVVQAIRLSFSTTMITVLLTLLFGHSRCVFACAQEIRWANNS